MVQVQPVLALLLLQWWLLVVNPCLFAESLDAVHKLRDSAAPHTWLVCVAAKGQEPAQPAG